MLIVRSDRFPLTTAARVTKTGLLGGLAFGLTQDALGLLRGRRPGYIVFMVGKGHSEADADSQEVT